MESEFPLLDEFVAFITERWVMHERRASGEEGPWTNDPILAKYRFTNVRREDDRVTRWIHNRWLRPHKDDPDVWFAMYVARVFNRTNTLDVIGYPAPWGLRKARVLAAANSLKAAGERVFGAAYMIHSMRTPGPYRPKINYYGEIFTTLWERRAKLRPKRDDTLQEFYERLMAEHGFGSFMAAQIIADVKWVEPLRSASDWVTFAASGPGSRRGLNRLTGRPVKQAWKEAEWKAVLLRLRTKVLPRLPKALRNLDAQNFNNAACEFDKYRRVVEGTGKPKQIFRPDNAPYI